MPKNTNREEWLGRLVEALRPLFADQSAKLPKKIRVSCGWPSRGGTGSGRKRTIGQAWSSESSADGTHETFISPVLDDSVEVAAVLVHEMVHHSVGVKEGHKRPFAKLAKALGLEGKMTATYAGADLKVTLEKVVRKLGDYPHSALDPTCDQKKQSTRMLKVQCENRDCGCVVRMTRKWLDKVGTPECGCGSEMVCEGDE